MLRTCWEHVLPWCLGFADKRKNKKTKNERRWTPALAPVLRHVWSYEEGRHGRAFILKSLFSFFARRGRMRKGVAGGHPFSKVIHILRRFFCFFCVTCGRMRKGVTGGHRFSKVLHVMGTYRLKKKSYTKTHRVKLGGHWLLRICVRFSRSCCHKDIIVNKGKYSATVAVIISYVNNNILCK